MFITLGNPCLLQSIIIISWNILNCILRSCFTKLMIWRTKVTDISQTSQPTECVYLLMLFSSLCRAIQIFGGKKCNFFQLLIIFLGIGNGVDDGFQTSGKPSSRRPSLTPDPKDFDIDVHGGTDTPDVSLVDRCNIIFTCLILVSRHLSLKQNKIHQNIFFKITIGILCRVGLFMIICLF